MLYRLLKVGRRELYADGCPPHVYHALFAERGPIARWFLKLRYR